MNIPKAFRLFSGVALAFGVALAAAPTLLAAPASSSGTATITVYARGGALGQRVAVQWGDAIGGWHTVDGWTAALDHLTPQGVPFQRFTVLSSNYGQKPFRWVIYYPDGVTVWAIGPWFTLPTQDGSDVGQPLDVQFPLAATPAPSSPVGPTGPTAPTAPASTEPLMNAHTFTYGLPSGSGSKIATLIGGLPSTVWIAVQWLDGYGVWHTVDGWQGSPSSVSQEGVLFQDWAIGPELLGKGPFRWIVYDFYGGTVIGVSPNFNMPTVSRQELFMSMAPYQTP